MSTAKTTINASTYHDAVEAYDRARYLNSADLDGHVRLADECMKAAQRLLRLAIAIGSPAEIKRFKGEAEACDRRCLLATYYAAHGIVDPSIADVKRARAACFL